MLFLKISKKYLVILKKSFQLDIITAKLVVYCVEFHFFRKYKRENQLSFLFCIKPKLLLMKTNSSTKVCYFN